MNLVQIRVRDSIDKTRARRSNVAGAFKTRCRLLRSLIVRLVKFVE